MTATHHSILEYTRAIQHAVAALDPDQLEEIVEVLFQAYLDGRTVFTLGNGASASLAAHMACDLGKGTAQDLGRGPDHAARKRLRILSLNDNPALMTAYSNDLGYEDVFVEQLKNLLQPGDIVLGISGSGGSENVLRALEYARHVGAVTLGLTGNQPSAILMKERTDICFQVALSPIEQIEDLHVIIHHAITTCLRERISTHTAFEISHSLNGSVKPTSHLNLVGE